MKRLNEHGWGLNVMLAFISVFFIAIIMIAYLSNLNGLGPSSNNDNSVDKNFVNQYKNYESAIKNEAIKYQEEKYPYIVDGDSFYVNIKKLSDNDEILQTCSGYVEFGRENNVYYYKPYLNCGSYKTNGYVSSLDK